MTTTTEMPVVTELPRRDASLPCQMVGIYLGRWIRECRKPAGFRARVYCASCEGGARTGFFCTPHARALIAGVAVCKICRGPLAYLGPL